MTDLDRLTLAISHKFGTSVPSNDFGWPAPALNVIDCVLSLNRRYNSFVLPRIYTLQRNRPEVLSLSQLCDLIDSYPTANHFLIAELNYTLPTSSQWL